MGSNERSSTAVWQKPWKPANTSGSFWEQAHTLCVHLFFHKQGDDRQEDVACESHAYLGQYHWGIILYYCKESTCTSSFHQREQLTVSLNTRSEPHRLTRNFVTKCSPPFEEVMCFAAQWYHFFSVESGKKFGRVEEQNSKQGAQSYAHRWPLQPPRGERERQHVIAAWLHTRAPSQTGAVSHPVACLSFPQLNRFVTENGVNSTLETFS